MATITLTLSSANMGDVDELDFDLWARWVSENIEEQTGVDADVDQLRFGEDGEDRISGADEEKRVALRSWLQVAWDQFCGQAWAGMREEAAEAVGATCPRACGGDRPGRREPLGLRR